MIDTPTIPETDQPLSGALLECVVAALIMGCCALPRYVREHSRGGVRAAQHALRALQLELESVQNSTKSEANSNSALLDLQANARMLRAAARAVSDKPRVVAQLPRVVLRAQKRRTARRDDCRGISSRRRREVFSAVFSRLDSGATGTGRSYAE